jgi:hypothetical protein
MLPAIAATAITRYTTAGDLVADLMCGIGTTLVEAIHLGRDAIGAEYEDGWARLAAAGVTHARGQGATGHADVIRGDARQLPRLVPPTVAGRVALVITSPPYGSSVHGHVRAEPRPGGGGVHKFDNRYGRDPLNLAHHGHDTMLAGLTEILRGCAALLRPGCAALLRPGGTVVVTARPWRQHGELIDLPGAVLAAGANAGLIPTERCVALLAGVRGGQLVARPSFFQLDGVRKARARGEPRHLIAHEDVLIFRAPAFPSSSAGLRGPQRELKGPARRFSHAGPGDAGELGAAA